MTRTVYKYPFINAQPGWVYELLLPSAMQPVHFGRDPEGEMCLWALVDPDTPPRKRRFVVLGTSWELPEGDWRHVSSIVDGVFVWHLFREKEKARRYFDEGGYVGGAMDQNDE